MRHLINFATCSFLVAFFFLISFSTTACAQINNFQKQTSQKQEAPKHDSQFDNILFKTPNGWRKVEQNGSVFLLAPGLPAGTGCAIGLIKSTELNGDFYQWFSSSVKSSLQNGEKIVQQGEIQKDRAQEGYDIVYTYIVVEDSKKSRSHRFYLGANPGSRAEMIVYIATSQELFDQHKATLATFIENTDFANVYKPNNVASTNSNKANPSATKQPKNLPSGNQLSGFYLGSEYRTQFNPATGYYDNIATRTYYCFFPDGRVYYGFPKGGQFDFAKLEREDSKNFGRYQISNNKISFNWNDGSSYAPAAFESSQNSITIGKTVYGRIDEYSNFKLDGTYSTRSFTNLSGGAGGVSGGVSGETTIVFTRDGRFSEKNFVGYTGAGSNASAGTSQKGGGAGTYSINGNTLELTYSDGRVQRSSFFVHPENAKESEPGLVVIDGGFYLLRK
ncbi:MAG: hypothetical protein JNN15_14595 [Blastocatellia bacterium]|nr:hypothetical protein [Blastocatellia bacterium]